MLLASCFAGFKKYFVMCYISRSTTLWRTLVPQTAYLTLSKYPFLRLMCGIAVTEIKSNHPKALHLTTGVLFHYRHGCLIDNAKTQKSFGWHIFMSDLLTEWRPWQRSSAMHISANSRQESVSFWICLQFNINFNLLNFRICFFGGLIADLLP